MEQGTQPQSSLTKDQQNEQDRLVSLHSVRSFVLALVIVLAAIAVVITLVATKPEPAKKEIHGLVPAVRVQPIVRGSHQVMIETQGVVRSLREVALSAEVGGRVTRKSPQLLEGGSVREGEVLLQIDAADYQAALKRAESAAADAAVALRQEEALAEQVAIDWRKLGRGEASDLVLRKPQLEAARARLQSASAEVERARRDVERTSIRAPFDARVRRVQVEVGAVLAPGSPLAELYSADQLEVRLPFSLQDYGYLAKDAKPAIELTATLGGQPRTWPAVLERIDGEVQRSTLSAYGLASVKPDAQGLLPPVGLFVEARVPGRQLEDVVVLPRAAVRGADEVWVVDDGKLAKRAVEVLRSGSRELVVKGEFAAGDRLVLTRLAAPLVGMEVEAMEDQAIEAKPEP